MTSEGDALSISIPRNETTADSELFTVVSKDGIILKWWAIDDCVP